MDNQIISMQQWYQELPGSTLVQLESAQLARRLPRFLGETALQIGGPADLQLLKDSPIRHQFQVIPYTRAQAEGNLVEVEFTELPFAANSIDLIVVAHTLEFIHSPRQLLSQLYQCLAPHGHLVILGFSPWSLWGLTRHMKRHHGLPWEGHFWKRSKVNKWLEAIGYTVLRTDYCCYQWPYKNRRLANLNFVSEVMGRFVWYSSGSVYMISAQKQIQTMTPIKASWWAKKENVRPGYCEPTSMINPCDYHDKTS